LLTVSLSGEAQATIRDAARIAARAVRVVFMIVIYPIENRERLSLVGYLAATHRPC
jgi:hypothetical protein